MSLRLKPQLGSRLHIQARRLGEIALAFVEGEEPPRLAGICIIGMQRYEKRRIRIDTHRTPFISS